MRKRLWVIVIAFVFVVTSCNLPVAQTIPTFTPATPMPDTPKSSIGTPTLANFVLPTLTLTATPDTFLAWPKDQPVNCRFGPGTSYAVTGALLPGRQAQIIARTSDSSWWYVRNPSDPSTSCWLSADFVETAGDVGALPVANAPGIMVTAIRVRVEPSVVYVACDDLPQFVAISADITASGPSTVVWHWELSTGFVSPDKEVLFAAGDTKTVQDTYQVNAVNDYRVQVQTTQPNIMTGQASFKVTCTP